MAHALSPEVDRQRPRANAASIIQFHYDPAAEEAHIRRHQNITEAQENLADFISETTENPSPPHQLYQSFNSATNTSKPLQHFQDATPSAARNEEYSQQPAPVTSPNYSNTRTLNTFEISQAFTLIDALESKLKQSQERDREVLDRLELLYEEIVELAEDIVIPSSPPGSPANQ
jgi:hypothetical protein